LSNGQSSGLVASPAPALTPQVMRTRPIQIRFKTPPRQMQQHLHWLNLQATFRLIAHTLSTTRPQMPRSTSFRLGSTTGKELLSLPLWHRFALARPPLVTV
jgi:hypothetical protein